MHLSPSLGLAFGGFHSKIKGKEYAYNIGDQVQSLGQKDLLEKGMATHSSILVFQYFLKNCMNRGAWWATVFGVAKSQTQLSN